MSQLSNKMGNGFFAFYRNTWEDPRSRDPHWIATWVWLLSHARFSNTKALFNGDQIELKPGQLITTVREISRATGVDPSKVGRILKSLETDKRIERRTSNVNSLITISYWDQEQRSGKRNEKPVKNEWKTKPPTNLNTNDLRRSNNGTMEQCGSESSEEHKEPPLPTRRLELLEAYRKEVANGVR